MKAYLLHIWDVIRSSYWFIPSILVLFAIALSFYLPWLDGEVADFEFPDWIKTTHSSARATLSTITGAMVAVTGTVFSITIVTLSLTSQQFGPRLLRSFMLDRITQVTLGVFLSTALYSVLILRVVEKHSDGPGPPHLAVLFSVILMVGSVGLLIVFIHHIAVLIQAPRIVEVVSDDLNEAVIRLFPETIGEAPESESQQDFEKAEKALSSRTFSTALSSKEGYIQALDSEGIMNLAEKEDLIIRFLYRPGDFIPFEADIAQVYGSIEQESLSERLNDSFIVGMRRTPRQDLECAVDELVEVAVRSLSPGINDPFTAMSCVDRLGAALRQLAKREEPSSYRFDSDGKLRLIMKGTAFPPVLDTAFNQIRQFSKGSVAVSIRLLEALDDIAKVSKRQRDQEAIKRHAEMVYRMSLDFPEEHDRADVKVRFDTVLERLARAMANVLES